MQRRNFLKLISIAPFIRPIDLLDLPVKNIPSKETGIYWTSKTGAEILEDLEFAVKYMREQSMLTHEV